MMRETKIVCYLIYIFVWAIKSGRQSYLICFFLSSATSKLWVVTFAMFISYPLVTKRGSNTIPDMIFYPRLLPSNCGWFRLLCLTHDHFIKPKAEKRKVPFLVTKRSQNHICHVFLIRNPQIIADFICYF